MPVRNQLQKSLCFLICCHFAACLPLLGSSEIQTSSELKPFLSAAAQKLFFLAAKSSGHGKLPLAWHSYSYCVFILLLKKKKESKYNKLEYVHCKSVKLQ